MKMKVNNYDKSLWDALNHAVYYVSRYRLLMIENNITEHRLNTPDDLEKWLANIENLLKIG